MTYRIAEVFDSIQGEGAQVGRRMVFVRFAGCNLWNGREDGRSKGAGACALWCDTDFLPRRSMTASELLAEMSALWPAGGERWCCITGGEPLLQLDHALCSRLAAEGWRIAVETNGTIDHGLMLDHVTVSPKKGGELNLRSAHALKVVLSGDDLAWSDHELRSLAERFRGAGLYVQPQSGSEAALRRCMHVVHDNPRWKLSVQMHKFIGVR